MPLNTLPNGALTVTRRIPQSSSKPRGGADVRSPVPGWGRGRAAAVRRLRRSVEAGLTAMLMILLYAAGAAAVAVYMVAALVFPEKF
jgi:hypothetical protein